MAHVLAILNQKGGVGKTTLSVNLAGYLAENNFRTAIIDLEPQGSATVGLGYEEDEIPEGKSISNVLLGQIPLSSILLPARMTPNLFLAPSDPDLAETEVHLMIQPKPRKERILADKIATIADQFDWIIVDGPPSLMHLALMAMTAADRILIPVEPSRYSMKGTRRFLEAFDGVKDSVNPMVEVVGACFNKTKLKKMPDGSYIGSKAYQRSRASLETFLSPRGIPILDTMIPPSDAIRGAEEESQPITSYKNWTPVARATADLMQEVLNRWQRMTQ